MALRIAQLGLGPIGLETLKLAATKPWAEIMGALEIDPAKQGRDLGELTHEASLRGCRVHGSLEELLRVGRPDVVLHTSVSKFTEAFPQIEPLAARGIDVVSSCEELVYPQLRQPELAARLDELCQAHGARVIGAGVNPGFVMDVLPLCLTGVSRAIRAIHIQRVVNASTRRESLQRKIGSGLAPADFRPLLENGDAGHAGLGESLALIAHGLGWTVEHTSEDREVVVADHPIQTAFFAVQPGQVCGIHQRIQARSRQGIELTLDIRMVLDAPEPHDSIQIEGDPPLYLTVAGGVAGDEATVAALVNTVPRLRAVPAGLRLLTELPLPRMG